MITGKFKMSQRALLSYLYSEHGRVWTIVFLVGIAILILAGIFFYDLRLIICGLIVLFIVVPMVIAYLYINYALDPECAYNTLLHTLHLDSDGIEITVYPSMSKKTDEGKDLEEAGAEDINIAHEADVEEISNLDNEEITFIHRVMYNDLHRYKVGLNSVIIPVGRFRRGFIYIPRKAFECQETFEDFIKRISSKMTFDT